jgi:maleylpyruvate isomerase
LNQERFRLRRLTRRGIPVKLYTYFRSSAAYRVRIALNLKGLPHEMIAIHLTKDGGRQRTPEFRAVNPQMRVPALELSSGEVLTQSLAIIEYLDDIHPEPPLLPADALERAKVRAVAQMVACDIHPLNNLAPLQYLKRTLKHEQPEIDAWYHHWVTVGFEAIEAILKPAPYARRHLPGAAGLQCAAAKGSARQIPEDCQRRGGLPETAGVR